MRKYPLLWLLGAMLVLNVAPTEAIDDLDQWTLQQKVAQMFVFSFYGETLNQPSRAVLESWSVGAVVLLPSNLNTPEQITRLTNDIQRTLRDQGAPPALIATDQEGGIIAHLEQGFTEFPVPALLTATQNPDLAYAFGTALAREMSAVGIHMNLAPVADLDTNPDNPVIGRRSFGSDPALVAPMVAQVVRGLQDHGVLATVKHFPGHGDTSADSHLELPIISHSQAQLEARELIPFRAAISADTAAIMTAHVYYEALQPQPDMPASLSSAIINDLLREQLGYDGLVITDALDMDAIDTVYTPAEAAIRAVQAGNDLILLGAHVSPRTHRASMQAVYDAVQNGTISEARIDASVARILAAKARFNMLNWRELDALSAPDRINRHVHTALVDIMFQQGITLVAGAELLQARTAQTLFVFPATRPSLWRECQMDNWRGLGVSQRPSVQEIQAVQMAAQSAERVIVITQNAATNAPLRRLVASLPAERTLVTAIWSPDDRRYLAPTAGYLLTYSPLTRLNRPLCAILRGEQPALGTLSVNLYGA
jgi:beta-N-acetylhexosaminidase